MPSFPISFPPEEAEAEFQTMMADNLNTSGRLEATKVAAAKSR